jgi:subtilisin family serine protease
VVRTVRLIFLSTILFFAVGTQAQTPNYVPGQVIVKFKKGSSIQSFNKGKASAMGMKHQGGWSNMNMHVYGTNKSATVQATIDELKNNPDVEYVEPNYILGKTEVEVGKTMTKSEAAQSGDIQSQANTMSQTGASIHAEDAWAIGVGTATPIVAIIDTGVDLDHEALVDAMWVNPGEVAGNGVDDDHNGYIDDINGWDFSQNDNNPNDGDGHGTHVAGIVRGTSEDLFNPGTPKLRIMAVRFLDDNGSGTTADAIKAIYYAVNNGATVLNNSWGGASYSHALLEAIAYSYQQHTIFVAASGNSSQNADNNPMYPAAYDVPNILSVAATTDADNLAWFSNYGDSKVQVASPGQSILSSYPNDFYVSMSGTSMATPFVSGIAALMSREKPTMWGYQLKTLIMSTGDYKANLAHKVSTARRVNVLNAVSGAQSASVTSAQPGYAISASSSDRELAGDLAGGGCGRVTKLYDEFNSPDKSSGGIRLDLFLLLLVVIPIAMVLLRDKKQYRRKHERFHMESTVRMKVGDQVFEGQLDTISLGGAGINMAAHLESGSVMTMNISSPDGKETVTVQGQIVWNQADKKYGVAFTQVESAVQQTIKGWTTELAKAK